MPTIEPDFVERRVPLDFPRQPEIGDVGAALAIEEDVRGLQVAVEDAALMGVVDGPTHGGDDLGGASRVGLQPGNVAGEAAAIDDLHAVIWAAVVLADLEDRDDPGMVEVGGGLGLAAEPAEVLLRGEPAVGDHLQSEDAVEAHLPGREDDAHPAPAELAHQLIIAEIRDTAPLGRGDRRGEPHHVGPFGCLQRVGQAIDGVEVGEEGRELGRVLRMEVDPASAIGRASAFGRFEVGGEDGLEPGVGLGVVETGAGHRS